MARSYWQDPLLACDFALMEVPNAAAVPAVLAFPWKAAQSAIENGNFIGMQNIDMPTMTLELEEVREGNTGRIYQIPTGFASGGDVTIRQAVMPLALDMYLWWQQAVLGRFGPRRHLFVVQTRRDKTLPARMYLCNNCIPRSYTPVSALDGNSGQVTTESMTFHTDNIVVIPVPASDVIPSLF